MEDNVSAVLKVTGADPDDPEIRFDVGVSDCCIFVVDDSMISRELLADALRASGFFYVVQAENGQQALDLLDRHKPDLVILDLNMPVMNGQKTCVAMRRDERTADVPIIVATANMTVEGINQIFGIGANDIFVKPLKAPQLVSRVRLHLENRIMMRSLVKFRKRMDQELDTAREMQRFLCPKPADIAAASDKYGVDIASVFRPTEEIGGDVCVMMDGGRYLDIYLADFAGHGLPAALNTFRLHAAASRFRGAEESPAEILAELNAEFCGMLRPGEFATLLWIRIDRERGRLIFSNAGAPPPIAICDGEDAVRQAENPGLPIGFVPDAVYTDCELELRPGLCFMAASDALTESRNVDGGMLGEAELLDIVGMCRRRSTVAERFECLLNHVEHGLGHVFTDDLTLIGIRAMA